MIVPSLNNETLAHKQEQKQVHYNILYKHNEPLLLLRNEGYRKNWVSRY